MRSIVVGPWSASIPVRRFEHASPVRPSETRPGYTRRMPTYEYQCTSCGHQIEVFQRITEDPLTTCGVCGGPLRKVFHPAGIVFKGSGFYATDSRKGSSKTGSDGSSSSSSSDGGAGKDKKKETKKDSGSGASGGSSSGSASSSGSSSSGSSSGSGGSSSGDA
jgi:putative FmdB family regulatory protein